MIITKHLSTNRTHPGSEQRIQKKRFSVSRFFENKWQTQVFMSNHKKLVANSKKNLESKLKMTPKRKCATANS